MLTRAWKLHPFSSKFDFEKDTTVLFQLEPNVLLSLLAALYYTVGSHHT